MVTNKPEYLTRPLLEALDLADECAVVVGGGTTTHTKPHPEPMIFAADRLAVKPRVCLMLGDDPRDIQAARSAGMTGLAAAWGYFPPDEDLGAWGAAAILQSPAGPPGLDRRTGRHRERRRSGASRVTMQ